MVSFDRPTLASDEGRATLFRSFFQAGFECSTHRLRNGRRLDMVAASRHDVFAAQDYARCRALGIRTAREGVRWHLVEARPGRYDFAPEVSRVRAARDAGMQVMWDLLHFGWPDHVDIFRADTVERFARFCREFARVVANETDEVPFYAPVNEISFLSWGGGDVAMINPFTRRRGAELKRQLVRMAIAGADAVWEVDPRARIVHPDPIIHICASPDRPRDRSWAERYRRSQFVAWDMIAGRSCPELGGAPRYLDVIGVNYYDRNQWIHRAGHIDRGHPQYRPLRAILREVAERYGRPMFIAETGIENDERPHWLGYVAEEVHATIDAGIPIEGICLYPIVNHPGWDDDRHCHNGLWDYADDRGEREAYAPLEQELVRQQRALRVSPRFGAPNTSSGGIPALGALSGPRDGARSEAEAEMSV